MWGVELGLDSSSAHCWWACGQNPTLTLFVLLMSMWEWPWRSTMKASDWSPVRNCGRVHTSPLLCNLSFRYTLHVLKNAPKNSHKSPKLKTSTMLKATYTLYFTSKITQKLCPRYVRRPSGEAFNDKWSVGAPDERESSQKNNGRHFQWCRRNWSALNRPTGKPNINTLTNYGYNSGGLRVHAPNFLEETSII